MFRLFKAATRSLRNIKTTVTGLTILIFLTSAIFTLLSDVRSAYNQKFDEYEQVSRLHDVTLDLDVNNEGHLPDGAYTQDAASGYNIDAGKETYMEVGTEGFQTTVLSQGYQPIDSFTTPVYSVSGDQITSEGSGGDMTEVFNTSYLVEDYQLWKTTVARDANGNVTDMYDSESLYAWDLDTLQFTPRESNQFMDRYELVNGSQELMFESGTTEVGQAVTTHESVHHFENLFNVHWYKEEWYQWWPPSWEARWWNYWEPIADMYINMDTNVLAVNNGTGVAEIQQWLADGVAYKLDKSIKEDTSWVRHLFGFLDVPFRTDATMTGGDGSWIHMHNAGHWLYYNLIYNYRLDLFSSYKNPNQLLMSQTDMVDWRHGAWGYEGHTSFTFQPKNRIGNLHGWSAADSDIPMVDSFIWPSSFGDVSFAHQASKAVLEFGTTYHIPANWTGNIKAETVYTKNTFELTDTNMWEGSYKTWWDSLSIEVQDSLQSFEYWTKSVIKDGYPVTPGEADPNGEFFGVVLTTDVEKNLYKFTYTDTGDIIKDGVNTNLLAQGGLTHPDFDRQEFITQFNAMTNSNKESENLAIISEGAANYTKLALEEAASNLVGENNIGRRTTMTISSFDTNANKNQVFHFVNASNNVVFDEESQEYVSQVGRMYYEELDPTALLYLDSTKPSNSFGEPFDNDVDFQFRQPPASYAASMIASIFRGYHISDEYFSVEVDYLEYAGEERQFVKLDAIKDPYLETTTGESFYMTQIGDKYHILQQVGDDLVPVEEDGNIREFTYSEMHALLDSGYNNENSFGFYLDGQINQTNGWYKISSVNKNLIIPVEYRNLPTTAIERAVSDDEYDVFISAIRQAMEGILSVGSNPWVSNEVMTYLTYGVEASMKENYFYTVMESGFIDKSHLGKIVFDALYLADQRHTQPILNRLFTDFIDHMKIELNKLSTEEEKRESLKTELANITTLFEDVFHLVIPFDITDYVDYTQDVNMLLDGFGDILASVNTDKWLSGIRSWYDENYDGIQPKVIGEHDGANLYNYFGTRELLTPLFSSQDGTNGAIVSVALTGGINKVIESLDFEMVMDDIITKVTDTLNTPTQVASIRNVFEMMGIDDDFSNVKEGLQNIIAKLDAAKMMDNISRAFNSRDYYFTKEVDGEIWAFKTSFVTELEMVSAIMGGIFASTSDHLDIVDYLVDMFNLSGKVDSVWLPSIPVIGPPDTNLVKPGVDDTALDLYDLQSLEMMSYSTLEKEADFMQSYYNAPDSEVNKKQAADILSDRYGVEIEWNNAADMKKYSDLYKTVMDKGYSLSQYNSNSNIQNDLTAENVNGNAFSMADNTLWTLKHRWKDLGAMGYSSAGAGEQAYQAVSEVTNSSNMAAGANSFVMWGYYFELIDMITRDLMNSGQSYDNAIRNAFTEVWAIIAAAENDPTLQRSEDVDDGKTTVSVIGIIVSETGPTTGSSVAIRPEEYTSILTPESGATPTTFQNGFARLKEVSPTFAEVTAANPEQFIRHMGLVAWSYSKKGLYDSWGSESTATGAETYRYWWALYHFIGYQGAETSWKQILYQGEEQLDAMMSFTNEFSQQTKIFDMLGLNTTVASTYMGALFPGVAKGSTIAFLQGDREGNIEYVVRRELDNLAGKGYDGWKNDLGDWFNGEDALPFEVESHGGVRLDLNMYQLQHTIDQMRESGSDTFFDLNISDLFESTIYSATQVHTEENQIRFMNIGAYVSKVSESYMLANNKKAYGADSSHVPIEDIDNIDDMVTLIETIDPMYTINVNNQKFLILGRETTVDYMYPVLDEANINVDTANQAVVFVNDYGFERVFQANQSTAVKDYLILSSDDFHGVVVDNETGAIVDPVAQALPLINQDINWSKHLAQYQDDPSTTIFEGTDEGLRDALNKVVDTRIESNNLQKAYLATEQDPINPERSMRVTTIQGVIDAVSQLQFYGVLILMVLVGLVTIFIAGRYVETRRVVIGILRAQGYSKHRIALSFIVFGVVTATVGGVAGYLVGHFLQIPLMQAFTTFWTVPTEPYTFSYVSLVTSVVAPVIGLSILIMAASLFILRSKPTDLMSGAAEASTGALQRIMIKPFKKFSIVTRFRTTLALGSFFKMMALAMTFALTATVALFTLGSVGVFDRALAGTYDQRDYEYATDLFTPTLEGGGYDVVDKNSADDLNQLYIPMGNNQESATHYWDYFKPGHSRIMDLKYYVDVPGGDSGYTDMTPDGKAHILTKSSLDLTVDSAIAANPWELAKNSMPDSQYVSALNITAVAAVQMMFEQFDPSWQVTVDGTQISAKDYYWNEYQYYIENTEVDSNGNMIDPFVSSEADRYMDSQFRIIALDAGPSVTTYYYHYQPSSNNDGTFLEYVFNHATGRFDARPISTNESSRERYREFLSSTYQNEDIQDYTMIYGGVNIDEAYDETYSWAEVTIDGQDTIVSNEKINMTGIDLVSPNSLVDPETDRGENIRDIIEAYNAANSPDGSRSNPYPIAPNEVVSRRWGINVGAVVASDVYNKTDRYLDNKILPVGTIDPETGLPFPERNDEVYFEVVAVNSTYINTEIIADQEHVNIITGMNLANWRDGITPFNGVMSDNEVPQQAIESLLLYSQSGYWGAMDTFQFPMSNIDVINNTNQIFGDVIDNNTGLLGSMRSATYIDADGNTTPVYSIEDLDEWVSSIDSNYVYQDLVDNIQLGLTNPDDPSIDQAFLEQMLRSYTGKYGNTIYSSAIHGITAQNTEAGFVTNITATVSTLVNASVIVTLAVSVIILIIISTMIVNENKKKIATFAVMGYSEWEKIRMFLFVYTPFILLGIGAAIPVAYGMVAVFNAVVLTTSNMALPLALTWWHIALATLITTVIITLTVSIAYRAIKNIKPIYILQGDD